MPCKLLAIENCSAISTGNSAYNLLSKKIKKIQGALLTNYLVQRDKTTKNGTILKRHIKQL
jgi:hypothetical protein